MSYKRKLTHWVFTWQRQIQRLWLNFSWTKKGFDLKFSTLREKWRCKIDNFYHHFDTITVFTFLITVALKLLTIRVKSTTLLLETSTAANHKNQSPWFYKTQKKAVVNSPSNTKILLYFIFFLIYNYIYQQI